MEWWYVMIAMMVRMGMLMFNESNGGNDGKSWYAMIVMICNESNDNMQWR